MRIYRLEIWLSRHGDDSIDWKSALFEYLLGCCGCRLISFYIFGITWLGDECLKAWEKK